MPELIEENLDSSFFEPKIVFTNRAYHARKLAQNGIGEYSYIIAVGGDGTVNEIASAVVGTDTVFGIIPCGSGNGLSRFLGIPMETARAVHVLNERRIELIDAAKLNRQWFFNMAGMGFDAHIAETFSHHKTRGFAAYIKSSVLEVIRYKADYYELDVDGIRFNRRAFMLCFANSSQFGNDAYVSPNASVQDGLLDVCVIKPFPLYRFPEMGIRLFNGSAEKSKYVEIIRGRSISVRRRRPGPVHLDGEPQLMGTEAEIVIVPRTLKIITGQTFKGAGEQFRQGTEKVKAKD